MENKDSIQIIVIYQNMLSEMVAIVNHTKKEYVIDFIEPTDTNDLQEETGHMVVIGGQTRDSVLNQLDHMGYTCK